MSKVMKSTYTLENINEILYQGFEYNLPDEILENISNLATQVGSPDYIKTPIFLKRENYMKVEPNKELISNSKEITGFNKKNKRGKGQEIINDDDWETIRTVQPCKTEEKTNLDSKIDNIRSILNTLSDKNYIDKRNKIIDVIDKLILENITSQEMNRVSSIIFDIASTNRFYSKMYADLYSDLSCKYDIMKNTFESNFDNFVDLFNIIEYVDSKVNYDKFCEINKANEKRKALASFYLNLMFNKIIDKKQIMLITRNLLDKLYNFISQDDMKNEVDELGETIAILYKKEIYLQEHGSDYTKIEGYTITEIIEKIANAKVKDYKSLTNKTLFKFMDLVDM